MPRTPCGARAIGKALALRVGSSQATKVASVGAISRAGHKERHDCVRCGIGAVRVRIGGTNNGGIVLVTCSIPIVIATTGAAETKRYTKKTKISHSADTSMQVAPLTSIHQPTSTSSASTVASRVRPRGQPKCVAALDRSRDVRSQRRRQQLRSHPN